MTIKELNTEEQLKFREELIEEQYQEYLHEQHMRTDWDYYVEHSKLTECIALIETCKEHLTKYGWSLHNLMEIK